MGHAMRCSMSIAAMLVCFFGSAPAQSQPSVAPIPKECAASADGALSSVPLPNVANALKERKKLKILAIGGTSASLRGPVSGGHYAIVERFLEQTFKGLDVEIVHRGVSGELAVDAAERIKYEVALSDADLVLWQLGTADALARVPIDDFKSSVSDTILWLKARNIDVILVGVRYARVLARDPKYQEIRKTLQDIAKERNVLRVTRYEAEEALTKVRQNREMEMVEITEAGYGCIAEFIARAIVAGLFVKERPPGAVAPQIPVPAPAPKN